MSVVRNLGMIFALTGCMSACSILDEGANQHVNNAATYEQAPVAKTQKTSAVVHSKQASSEPVQASTPGPKRAAAPQIPVIQ